MDDLVAVGTFVSHVEAELARTALEAAGIDSMIQSDDAGGMYPTPWLAWNGGISVFVRREDAEAARDVLESEAVE